MSLRIANSLYWQKLKEDAIVYFDFNEQTGSSNTNVKDQKQVKDQAKADAESIRNFLLSIYYKVSPSVIDGTTLVSFNKSREQYVNESLFYSDIWHSLD